MTWARIGSECICVFDGNRGVEGKVVGCPPVGTKCTVAYTIQSVFGDGLSLVIAGFPNFCKFRGVEIGWHISRFRPIASKTKSEDVAMFKRIADQVPNMEENTNEQV